MSRTPRQQTLAEQFHREHDNVLVLPNAWDPPSARMIQQAGGVAVATTSAGVSWSRGVADAGGLDRRTALDAAARMIQSVTIPVTVDIEWGYSGEPGGIEATIDGVLEAGAVGVNIEDSRDGKMAPASEHAELLGRISRVVAAGTVPLFINARVDTFLFSGQPDDAPGVLEEAIERAQVYVSAGAHGVFVPGVSRPDTIRRLVDAVNAPVNVMVGAGSPPVAEIAALGVRRISVGPQLATAAYGATRDWARSILQGSFTELPSGVSPGDLQPAQ